MYIRKVNSRMTNQTNAYNYYNLDTVNTLVLEGYHVSSLHGLIIQCYEGEI